MTFGSPGNKTPSRCSERWHGRKKSPDKRPENGRIKSRMTGWLWPNPTSNGGGFRPRIRWGNGMDGGRDVAPRRFRCTYSAAAYAASGGREGPAHAPPRGSLSSPSLPASLHFPSLARRLPWTWLRRRLPWAWLSAGSPVCPSADFPRSWNWIRDRRPERARSASKCVHTSGELFLRLCSS